MNRVWLIVFGDFLSFLISFILLIFIRFSAENYFSALDTHTVPFFVLYLIWVIIFYIFGLYDLVTIKPTIPYLRRWIWALAVSFVVGLLLFYFMPIFGISPKVNLFIQVALFGIFSFVFRRSIYAIFAKALTRPAIFVGGSTYLMELKNAIEKNPQIGLKIINHVQSINEVEIGKINVKDLIIILDKKSDTSDDTILDLYKQGVEIIDTAKAYEKYLFKIPVHYIDMAFIVEHVSIKKDMAYTLITFLVDKIFAVSILVLSSPLWIPSAIAVYLYDKGPILYTHERVGLGGKIFKIYKIRSMIVDSEKNGASWTEKNDPRITPVGRITRKLHIDEIPQMISILKGDMSLVGPRPERPEFVYPLEGTIPHYKLRHIVRPGFTGWAQIKYHYTNTIEESKEKFEYDLYYIKNRNIFLDFGIIMRTVQIIFTH